MHVPALERGSPFRDGTTSPRSRLIGAPPTGHAAKGCCPIRSLSAEGFARPAGPRNRYNRTRIPSSQGDDLCLDRLRREQSLEIVPVIAQAADVDKIPF